MKHKRWRVINSGLNRSLAKLMKCITNQPISNYSLADRNVSTSTFGLRTCRHNLLFSTFTVDNWRNRWTVLYNNLKRCSIVPWDNFSQGLWLFTTADRQMSETNVPMSKRLWDLNWRRVLVVLADRLKTLRFEIVTKGSRNTRDWYGTSANQARTCRKRIVYINNGLAHSFVAFGACENVSYLARPRYGNPAFRIVSSLQLCLLRTSQSC